MADQQQALPPAAAPLREQVPRAAEGVRQLHPARLETQRIELRREDAPHLAHTGRVAGAAVHVHHPLQHPDRLLRVRVRIRDDAPLHGRERLPPRGHGHENGEERRKGEESDARRHKRGNDVA
ncbi:MAG TPA: hypothetical protein VGO40_14700 [Longimicrobium sp.]|nr:hypothetical protein [Longimicrobium sp.]